jgi:hypothetical protein
LLELIKYYNVGINYTLDKANVVVDAPNQNYCNDLLAKEQQPYLHRDLWCLDLELVEHGYLATLEVKPILEDQIRLAQKENVAVFKIKVNLKQGSTQCLVFFKMKDLYGLADALLCQKLQDLKDRILREDHDMSLSIIHPGSTISCHDLR